MISPIFGLHYFLEITIFQIRLTNIIYKCAKITSFQPLNHTSSPTFKIFEKYEIFMKL